MARMKTFFIYFILLVVAFVVSQVLIYVAINTTYNYKNVEIKTTQIKEAEVKATSINGYAKFKFADDNVDTKKYVKVECYTKNDVLIGTKYIKVEQLQANDKNEFEIRFNYNRIDKAIIDVVDEIPENVNEEQKVSDPKMTAAMTISALIFLFTFA